MTYQTTTFPLAPACGIERTCATLDGSSGEPPPEQLKDTYDGSSIGIVAEPDRAVWFTKTDGRKIGRIA